MLGGRQAAYAAGLATFTAAMTGLAALAQGRRERFEVTMLDVLVWVNWKAVGASLFRAGDEVHREGRQAEWQVLRCRDGFVAMVYNERDWPQLARLVGHPDLLDSELESGAGRAARRSTFMPHIERWCAERTRDEIYRSAQAVRVPVGPVVPPADLATDPQIRDRGAVAEVELPGAGRVRMPLVPLQWNGEGFVPRPEQAPVPATELVS